MVLQPAVDWVETLEYEDSMQCPSCGDSFDWFAKFAEIVTCRTCQSVSRVGDGQPILAGESTKLIANDSGLGIGVSGSFKGIAFTTVGRVRYGYPQGFWDEWCIQTAEGELLWINEDDGNLSYSRALKLHKALPPLEQLTLGRSLFLADHDYLIEEIGKAKCLGTEGQLPFSAIPGDEIDYLGLRAGKTQTATVEIYDGEVHFYQGRRISLRELHLINPVMVTTKGPTGGFTLASSDTTRLGCYACGAPLSAASVNKGGSCEFCGASLEKDIPQIDCHHCDTRFGVIAAEFITQAQCPKCFKGIEIETQGTITNLQVFTKPMEDSELSPEKHRAAIHPFKLGQRANFNGQEFVLTGHLRNETVEDGISYYSDSFHLLSKDGDVRWLDREDGHYVLSERIGPVPERLLNYLPKTQTTFNGRNYQFFDSGESSVCSVQGQFTYAASILDKSSYYDFISPPHYLSAEVTDREIEGFAGRYFAREDIATAFQMPQSTFITPSTVGPSQPYDESALQSVARTNLPFYLLFFVVLLLFTTFKGSNLEASSFNHEPGQIKTTFETISFDVSDTPTTISLELDTTVDNSWVYIDAEFLDGNDELVHVAAQTISYYHGYEGGESWSEGSQDHEFLFRVQQPGTYRFRLTSEGDQNTRVNVQIEEDVWLSRFPLAGLILSAIVFLFITIRRSRFEHRRWQHLHDDE